MSKFVATTNKTLLTTGGSGSVNITTPASTKVKASNFFVLKGNQTVVASGMISDDGTCGNANGTGVIIPSSTKMKAEGNFVVLENDSVTYTCNGTQTAVPHAACSFSVTTKISSAGQTKLKAT